MFISSMEAHLSVIETKASAAETSLAQIQGKAESTNAEIHQMKIELSVLKQRIAHVPSKLWMMGIIDYFFNRFGNHDRLSRAYTRNIRDQLLTLKTHQSDFEFEFRTIPLLSV